MENQGEIIIYQTEDGLTHIEVKIEDETSLVESAANGRLVPNF